jgi:hypothetical protein
LIDFILFLKTKKIIIICKIRKTQEQNLEFGHTWGEIQIKTCNKSTLALKGEGGVETLNPKLTKPSIFVVN